MAKMTSVGPARTNEEIANRVITRLGQLKTWRSPWEELWQEIADFVQPRRSHQETDDTRGQMLGDKIYDGSPGSAAQMLADGMEGYYVSPSFEWINLHMEDPRLEQMPGVRRWLEEVQEHLYSVLRRSNFYQSMSEYFLDAATIGTATIYSEEDPKDGRINFSCRHPWEVYIAEDQFNRVDTHYREFRMTGRAIEQRFGDQCPEAIKRANETNPDERYTVIHACFPSSDSMIQVTGRGFPTLSMYVLPASKKANEWPNRLVKEGGYRTNPYQTWRWRTNSNEIYGRSPAADAIYDIKMANQIGRTMLKAAQRSVEGPYNVPSTLRGQVRLGPLGLNYYKDPNQLITPIPANSNYPLGIDQQERTRQIIEQRFYADLWLLLSRTDRQMTAREVIEKQGEKAALLGTVIGRLDSECLDPLIDRVLDIEYESGRLPPIPPALLMAAGAGLRIEYLGPLAQAQRRLFKTQGPLQALEAGLPLAQVDPSVLDFVDLGKAFELIMRELGMPEDAMRDEREVRSIRVARVQAQQAQMQMQALESMGKSMQGLSKKIEPGSAGEQVMKALPQGMPTPG
jgi:hypothetical protein